MEIRLFQWLIPLISLLFIMNQLLRYRKGRLNMGEALFGAAVWLAIAMLAIFPDRISKMIAHLFGIESNTNAVMFFGLGVLFYMQYQMYRIIVRQRRAISELNRQLAIRDFEQQADKA
ncbi:MAG: DUF2304 domain-containing protein [Bacteroidetes bacterium]|nr:MAG: DUF2304 domain-containing protein [Bacteroidota bacterium]